jgi:regulatory protein
MKITSLSAQQKNPNRVNVMVDGKYRFSLEISQVGDLGIKVGKEFDEAEIIAMETEGQFGKVYALALEYCLMRPHSSREMRDYLYRKTRATKYRSRRTGEVKDRPGVSTEITARVFERLLDRGYIDDEKFTKYWIENRNLTKGASKRKLQSELAAKGIERSVIEKYLSQSERSDADELQKIIAKKRAKYPDEQKLMNYLARQGFAFDDIKSAISESNF